MDWIYDIIPPYVFECFNVKFAAISTNANGVLLRNNNSVLLIDDVCIISNIEQETKKNKNI